jgi:hypothetical protein
MGGMATLFRVAMLHAGTLDEFVNLAANRGLSAASMVTQQRDHATLVLDEVGPAA